MYAAHFAAGLAINAAEPRAPTWAVMGAVFLPDLFWLGLSLANVEPVGPGLFFDGWSHSIAAMALQALIAGLVFLPYGRSVAIALAGAVLSHIPLDIPIHPRPLELYPHSAATIGAAFRGWGVDPSWFGKSHYWWVETDVILILLAIYAVLSPRAGIRPNIVAAGAILVAGLQIAFG
jgi:hypothetical protein